jgi:hypothetical protein
MIHDSAPSRRLTTEHWFHLPHTLMLDGEFMENCGRHATLALVRIGVVTRAPQIPVHGGELAAQGSLLLCRLRQFLCFQFHLKAVRRRVWWSRRRLGWRISSGFSSEYDKLRSVAGTVRQTARQQRHADFSLKS